MRYLRWVLAPLLLITAALASSYYTASVANLLDYVNTAAAAEPACRAPAVVASLSRSLNSAGLWRLTALTPAMEFQTDQDSQLRGTRKQLKYIQRYYWLRAIGDRDHLASAFCAISGPGRDRNLPAIGAMVGIRDVTQTDPQTLRALTDAYVNCMHGRIPDEQVRRRFQKELRERTC